MTDRFGIITIVGMGLIGGSLAAAIKEKGLAGEVRAYDRDREATIKASSRGFIDTYKEDLEEVVEGSELIILAVPVGELLGIAKSLLDFLPRGAIISDVGSVKSPFIRGLEPHLPPHIHLVGGHPIAGTERSGIEAAFPQLFVNTKCILTPSIKTPGWALDKVRDLWEQLGVEVIIMDPEEHDRSMAEISHLPHMVAYSLVNTIREIARENEKIVSFPAGGFKDFTRVASSHPIMWRDICLANRTHILEALDRFKHYLTQIRSYIANGEGEALEREFGKARSFRSELLAQETARGRERGLIITIDGPASAGKSTLARMVAQDLNYRYVNTGAIYRALAWKAREMNISWEDPEALERLSAGLTLCFETQADYTVRIYIEGQDITDEIKDEEIGRGASTVSAYARVRKALIDLQRDLGRTGGVIMEGRDLGTVIFPDADIKFFLDATVETRAYRRYRELRETGLEVDYEDIKRSLSQRDLNDSQRATAPLSKAPDAIYIDTTRLSVEEVKAIMLKEIKGRLSQPWRF